MNPQPIDPAPASGADEGNWERVRSEFGATLGLDGPVPANTLEAALTDETYADNLLSSRRHPVLLQRLIAAPPPRRRPAAPALSGAALARKATIALGRWAATGFATVDAATRETRSAACRACPHRRPGATAADLGSCGLCGCPLGRKISMTTEGCPDAHPGIVGQTRWSEPAARAG